MTDQLIGSGAKRWMPCKGAVLRTVNHPAGVLDTDAHSKGLLFHAQSLREKRLHSIPGRMSDAQKNRVRQKLTALSFMIEDSTFDVLSANQQFLQAGLK